MNNAANTAFFRIPSKKKESILDDLAFLKKNSVSTLCFLALFKVRKL